MWGVCGIAMLGNLKFVLIDSLSGHAIIIIYHTLALSQYFPLWNNKQPKKVNFCHDGKRQAEMTW